MSSCKRVCRSLSLHSFISDKEKECTTHKSVEKMPRNNVMIAASAVFACSFRASWLFPFLTPFFLFFFDVFQFFPRFLSTTCFMSKFCLKECFQSVMSKSVYSVCVFLAVLFEVSDLLL